MKKRSNIFEMLTWLVILAALVPAFGSRSKRFKWSKCIIAILVIALLCRIGYTIYDNTHPYQNCIPATMHRVFPSHSIKEIGMLCDTKRDGTYLDEIPLAWAKLSTNFVYAVYSAFPTIKSTDEELSFTHPYLWVGNYDKGAHCALVTFTQTNVIMSHSQFIPGTTNYYKVTMDYETFFKKTYVVYTSKDLNENVRM